MQGVSSPTHPPPPLVHKPTCVHTHTQPRITRVHTLPSEALYCPWVRRGRALALPGAPSPRARQQAQPATGRTADPFARVRGRAASATLSHPGRQCLGAEGAGRGEGWGAQSRLPSRGTGGCGPGLPGPSQTPLCAGPEGGEAGSRPLPGAAPPTLRWALPWRPPASGRRACRAGEGCWLALPHFLLARRLQQPQEQRVDCASFWARSLAGPLPLPGPVGSAHVCSYGSSSLRGPSEQRAVGTSYRPGSLGVCPGPSSPVATARPPHIQGHQPGCSRPCPPHAFPYADPSGRQAWLMAVQPRPPCPQPGFPVVCDGCWARRKAPVVCLRPGLLGHWGRGGRQTHSGATHHDILGPIAASPTSI